MNSKSSDGNGAKQSPPDVELLTPKEAAQVLKLSESFLAKARMRGDGPRYRKLSRSVRYLKADLLAWLKACAKTSTAERLQDDRRPAVDSKEQKAPTGARKNVDPLKYTAHYARLGNCISVLVNDITLTPS
jgi:predicted DNA-binding transcriptional regulator AlpA